jgi:putative membrane protein
MHYGWYPTMAWGASWIGLFFTIVFWVFITFVVVAVVRGFRGKEFHSETKTPLEILKERYAKGEVNKKEYEEIKKEIK